MWICSDRRYVWTINTEATQLLHVPWEDPVVIVAGMVKISSPNNPTDLNRMSAMRDEVNASGCNCCELQKKMYGELLNANQ